MIRSNYDILGAWSAAGINLANTRFPVTIKGRPTTPDGLPDLADVIYGIHRCTHGHGDELPAGFTLVPYERLPGDQLSLVTLKIVDGSIRLSDLTIMGMCMVAVAAPANADQQIPPSYYGEFLGQRLPIAKWWGNAQELKSLIGTFPVPQVTLDFDDWMDGR